MQNDQELIESFIRQDAENCGYSLKEENVSKIARAKSMMFGLEHWRRCPCDGENPDRFCGSALCTSDIESKGICHCNLHCLRRTDNENERD